MFGWLSEARVFASLEAGHALGVGGKGGGQQLDRDVAIERRVAGAIDLAHAACPERAEDLVDAESASGADQEGPPSEHMLCAGL
jgi:hypothetical protein